MRLNVKAFAITCALIWGFGVFFLTWWVIAMDGATGQTTLIGRFYRGYEISAKGSLYGLLWGAADGLIGGAVFACLYNFLRTRFESDRKKPLSEMMDKE